jgi:hypothetical protein
VTGPVKAGEIHQVVVEAADVVPGQLCVTDCEGLSLYRELSDARILFKAVTGDLELEIPPLEAI